MPNKDAGGTGALDAQAHAREPRAGVGAGGKDQEGNGSYTGVPGVVRW